MRCTATSDPAADLDAQQCDQQAVAIVGLTSDEVRVTGRVCALHVDGALAWLHGLGVGTVTVTVDYV
ncbi:MAG: hypothetical protein F2842_02130 [Actinobacteria bacterium]|nr:hypothetical protein [Actinomycetota bacterium]